MTAFEEAVACGVDGIELDVHLSKDGEVMIMHDEALSRTTGRSGIVSDYTRAELEAIGVGKAEDGSWNSFPTIPSLEEYFSVIGGRAVTNIELKTAPLYYPGIEEKVAALIRRFSLEDRVIISSFNWLSVLRMKEVAPELEYALLFSGMRLDRMGSLFREMGIRYFHPDLRIIDEEIVRDLHDNGIGVNVWTVNDEEGMKRCIALGVDSVITNYPDIAAEVIDDSQKG